MENRRQEKTISVEELFKRVLVPVSKKENCGGDKLFGDKFHGTDDADTSRQDREEASGSTCRAVVITGPGGIDDIEIRPIEPMKPSDREVQILVRAFSMNFGDLLSIKGLYPTMPDYPFTPGFEVAGTVISTGREVTKVKAGDDVIGLMGMNMGGHSCIVNADERLVVRKPDNISFEEACAFPVAFLTMYYVFEKISLKRGEKILIQTATGGTGLIAVQLAALKGAEIFATAGSQKKLDYLKGMGVHHVINYLEEDFELKIMDITRGYGVDVVINTLSGDAIQKGLNILAPDGRYAEIAMTGLKTSKRFDLSNLVQNQTFYSIDMRRLLYRQPDLVTTYLDKMVSILEEGCVKPTIGRCFPFSQVKDAYRYLENRLNIGKVVVSIPVAADARTAVEVKACGIGQRVCTTGGNDIAVIGVAGRFPGARNVNEFWDNLKSGKNCITEVPKSRWDIDYYYDPDPGKLDKTYCRWGGFVDDIELFDPLFFNISGKEAELTDPQQRKFLEECWNALEDSGYATEKLNGKKCGVFVGVGSADYHTRMHVFGLKREAQSFWGNASSVLASRISYYLNLKGPSVAIDTACSSSLVAIHLGCQSILSGECDMVIAGGVFISTTPDFYIVCSNAGMLSTDGRCKTFDNGANGFVPGEGVGAIVLKPLEAAIRDRDNIYGVIKGSGMNQDGKTNGLTAPSTLSQTELEVSVYNKSGINPETISYVEAHGTGTKLGDPIEMEALTNAFTRFTDRKQYCAIGSVKTNIGHAVTAAGIASVIKVLMALKHRQIPPSINFERKNEHIDFENSPFYVNTVLREWKTPGNVPRRAAVSSFGFSGTNCHMIIEEVPE
ncbi:MAG: beta-ketoacyl synthase N-terminal-like domain-containing protein [Acetivibrionales bacterium]